MKLVGQLAILILVLLGIGVSVVYFFGGVLRIAIPILIWTLCMIFLGIWTLNNSKFGFIVTLAFYIVSIIVKYLFNNGEYLILYLVHFYFISSITIAIWGCIRSKSNERT